MNPTRPAVWKAALISGVSLGVLAALPIVGTCLNLCCCGLAAAAGFFAALFYLSETRPSGGAPYGDGALVGFLTGAIGAAVMVALTGLFRGILVAVGWTPRISGLEDALHDADLPPAIAEFLEAYLSGAGVGCAWLVGAFAVWFVVYSVFSIVGAVVSVAMFHDKREGSPQFGPPPGAAPPAPPSEVPPPPPPAD